MAIDTRRKRASVAALGLAFLGPSIVPDATLEQADRQAVAHSYYGILAGSAFVQIGGTSQLEPFTSSGGITLERTIGGTSQLEAFTASGGITLERTIGGTSQIEAFSSSGGITVGDAVAAEVTTDGGGGGRTGPSDDQLQAWLENLFPPQWEKTAQEKRDESLVNAPPPKKVVKLAPRYVPLEEPMIAELMQLKRISELFEESIALQERARTARAERKKRQIARDRQKILAEVQVIAKKKIRKKKDEQQIMQILAEMF
jgi:hypothetical protein